MSQQPDRCPLCQQPNGCAVAAGATGEIHCWCMQQSFADAALPGNDQQACLCQACLQRLAALG
jgi:Cysteine-rich CWC